MSCLYIYINCELCLAFTHTHTHTHTHWKPAAHQSFLGKRKKKERTIIIDILRKQYESTRQSCQFRFILSRILQNQNQIQNGRGRQFHVVAQNVFNSNRRELIEKAADGESEFSKKKRRRTVLPNIATNSRSTLHTHAHKHKHTRFNNARPFRLDSHSTFSQLITSQDVSIPRYLARI